MFWARIVSLHYAVFETVVLGLLLRDLSRVQQSDTTMEEPVPSNVICGASQPAAVPDRGATQPAVATAMLPRNDSQGPANVFCNSLNVSVEHARF